MVEFALISPLLFLILLGVVDFGRAFYYWTTVANAAREGARYGTTHPNQITSSQKPAPNNLLYHVQQEAGTAVQLDPSLVSVVYVDTTGSPTCDAVNPPAGGCTAPAPTNPSYIKVVVSYDFTAFTPLISNIWGGGALRIKSSAQMVIE
jgi:Flp pilus assembly protein TadG